MCLDLNLKMRSTATKPAGHTRHSDAQSAVDQMQWFYLAT